MTCCTAQTESVEEARQDACPPDFERDGPRRKGENRGADQQDRLKGEFPVGREKKNWTLHRIESDGVEYLGINKFL